METTPSKKVKPVEYEEHMFSVDSSLARRVKKFMSRRRDWLTWHHVEMNGKCMNGKSEEGDSGVLLRG